MMASNITCQDHKYTHETSFLTGVITPVIVIENKVYMGRRGEYAPSFGNRGYRDTCGSDCTLKYPRASVRLQKSFTLSVFNHFKGQQSKWRPL